MRTFLSSSAGGEREFVMREGLSGSRTYSPGALSSRGLSVITASAVLGAREETGCHMVFF